LILFRNRQKVQQRALVPQIGALAVVLKACRRQQIAKTVKVETCGYDVLRLQPVQIFGRDGDWDDVINLQIAK
jgi:hypothetical protein